ncbi:hypothetical protein TanjilG_23501 [Lupinus angustifolius]|uniref:Uncharacterized protein n=1 Tax=Lupinus angustifolius TaxID=3871 RepID=A0A4P1R9D2_LUPAN|nr:hypothetical protein TanjilG_23501 [Lupinus angustifolius]
MAPDFNTFQSWPIFTDLNEYWPNLNGKNINLWQDEWKKHGSCGTLDPLGYFTLALELYKNKLNVPNLLPNLRQHCKKLSFITLISFFWSFSIYYLFKSFVIVIISAVVPNSTTTYTSAKIQEAIKIP